MYVIRELCKTWKLMTEEERKEFRLKYNEQQKEKWASKRVSEVRQHYSQCACGALQCLKTIERTPQESNNII